MATVLWDLDGSSIGNFMKYKTITDVAVLNDVKVVVSEGDVHVLHLYSDAPVHR
jgi:hypothetical protein